MRMRLALYELMLAHYVNPYGLENDIDKIEIPELVNYLTGSTIGYFPELLEMVPEGIDHGKCWFKTYQEKVDLLRKIIDNLTEKIKQYEHNITTTTRS